jgi:hypothetical protein
MEQTTRTPLALVSRRARQEANTFDFLGFAHYGGGSRKGTFLLGRTTACKKFRNACREMNTWLAQVRNVLCLREIWRVLAAKRRGQYNDDGVRGNSRGIAKFGYVTVRAVQQQRKQTLPTQHGHSTSTRPISSGAGVHGTPREWEICNLKSQIHNSRAIPTRWWRGVCWRCRRRRG